MNGSQTGKFRDPALVDFGTDGTGPGRRLERLGGVLVDRPSPGTTALRERPGLWQDAAAVFRDEPTGRRADGRGEWDFRGQIPEPWQVAVPLEASTLVLEVHPAPSGQLGVFLEQAGQWRWLHRAIRPGMAILSLFAHSGAASLAAAAAGADVVHVDASRQAIALARRNADASGCRDLPISWICEDAATFVTRCLRRGRRFAGIVLDPPSWGHGPKGQAFAIDRDLPPLLDDIARLLDPATRGPVLLTCHSSGWHPPRLRETLERALAGADPGSAGGVESGPLDLLDDTGRPLTLGGFARRDSAV